MAAWYCCWLLRFGLFGQGGREGHQFLVGMLQLEVADDLFQRRVDPGARLEGMLVEGNGRTIVVLLDEKLRDRLADGAIGGIRLVLGEVGRDLLVDGGVRL